jgi:LDH2 family malate/lactate/ureidoglycolate dehydrogenase
MTAELIPAERLAAFAAAALVANGLPEADARTIADLMIEADLLGADGHGIFRLPRYLARLQAGGFARDAEIRVVRRKGGTALIDGGNGFGHLVMARAGDLVQELASAHGIGWVGTRMSNHAGAAGVHTLRLAERGFIGIYLAVGNANHMAPWGGRELLLSTNPISIAIPARNGPVLLDMATTVAAYGKVKLAADRGEMMPEGWMIDAEGRPLLDPARADGGSLLPIGGPKGSGLSLMFGLLAGTLNGAALGRDVIDFNADASSPTNTGQAIVALDISCFADPAEFAGRVDSIRTEIRTSAPRPGFDSVRLPGERSLAERERRRRVGIPVPQPLLRRLETIAQACKIAPLI